MKYIARSSSADRIAVRWPQSPVADEGQRFVDERRTGRAADAADVEALNTLRRKT